MDVDDHWQSVSDDPLSTFRKDNDQDRQPGSAVAFGEPASLAPPPSPEPLFADMDDSPLSVSLASAKLGERRLQDHVMRALFGASSGSSEHAPSMNEQRPTGFTAIPEEEENEPLSLESSTDSSPAFASTPMENFSFEEFFGRRRSGSMKRKLDRTVDCPMDVTSLLGRARKRLRLERGDVELDFRL